jgi:hypothetical protein
VFKPVLKDFFVTPCTLEFISIETYDI